MVSEIIVSPGGGPAPVSGSGFLAVFHAGNAIFPGAGAASISFPGAFPTYPAVSFPASQNTRAHFAFIMPLFYAGGSLVLDIWFTATSGPPNIDAKAALAKASTGKDLSGAAPLTRPANAAGVVNGTTVAYTTVDYTPAQADNPAAGDPMTLRLLRDGAADAGASAWDVHLAALREV